MSSLALILALSSVASSSGASMGVVRFAVDARDQTAMRVRTATVVHAGDQLTTGPAGWLELHLRGDERIRVSAGSAIELQPGRIVLARGRVWVRRARGPSLLVVEIGRAEVKIAPKSSVVIEHDANTGSFVAERAGFTLVQLGDQSRALKGGVLSIDPDGRLSSPKSGGQAHWSLVSDEARAALGDLTGVSSYLVDWALESEHGAIALRRFSEVMRLDPEVLHEAIPENAERALRPPPFFEDEQIRN